MRAWVPWATWHAVAVVWPCVDRMRDPCWDEEIANVQTIFPWRPPGATCGQRVAICGVAGVNTPAHARSEPCAHLITVEKPQAGSLGWYALVAQGIEQRFPNTTVGG